MVLVRLVFALALYPPLWPLQPLPDWPAIGSTALCSDFLSLGRLKDLNANNNKFRCFICVSILILFVAHSPNKLYSMQQLTDSSDFAAVLFAYSIFHSEGVLVTVQLSLAIIFQCFIKCMAFYISHFYAN